MSNNQTSELHPRNIHRQGYDFELLVETHPPLRPFVKPNKYGNLSIDFFDPQAVKSLNAALLRQYYNIEWWEIPPTALTPPIPGRADYIHYAADLLGVAARKNQIRCLDIGVGANCIYPIIGCTQYGWQFVGSDISSTSLDSARAIVERNPSLTPHIELRRQPNPKKIFEGVVRRGERFDVTICNPPFHDSPQSATRASLRKLRGLKGVRNPHIELNFGGCDNELWCPGGEREFISLMIHQSREYATSCRWFTSLISNEDNIAALKEQITKAKALEHRVIEMSQGNKRSRIIAWRY